MSEASANYAGLLTATGRGAIAVVRVEGPLAPGVVSQHFCPATSPDSDLPLQRHAYGLWRHDAGEEEVVLVRQSTAAFEICTHGGRVSAESVLSAFHARGFSILKTSEFLDTWYRDRWAAESQRSVLEAPTLKAVNRLLRNADGRLAQAISELRSLIQNRVIPAAIARLRRLQQTLSFGRRLQSGWRIVIAGLPNVGKSTLLNRLLGFDRSIVLDQPGVTRDVVRQSTAIAGWPIVLSDTAGHRDTDHPVESQGVVRAESERRVADLLLLVSDQSQPWSQIEAQLYQQSSSPVLLIHNKSDLPADAMPRPPGLPICLLHPDSIQRVIAAIEDRLFAQLPDPDEPLLTADWQWHACQSALEALQQESPDTALSALDSPLH